MQIILVTPHGNYRNPNEAELRWQVYTTLCYGATGISYFTYWGPRQWTGNIIDDGKRTPHYAMVRRINRCVKALASYAAETAVGGGLSYRARAARRAEPSAAARRSGAHAAGNW